MFERMLKIKKIKEEKKLRVLQKQQQQLRISKNKVKEQKKILEDYNTWRVKEEHKLFEDIKIKPVQLRELEQMQQKIAMMRKKENDHLQDLKACQHKFQQEKEKLTEARKNHAQARITVEKFTKLCEEEKEKIAAENQYKEEIEQEEYAKGINDLGQHYG